MDEKMALELVWSVSKAIEFKRDLKPCDLMVIVDYIVSLWRDGVYTSAEALTNIQRLLTS
jgi:hypothetical protein